MNAVDDFIHREPSSFEIDTANREIANMLGGSNIENDAMLGRDIPFSLESQTSRCAAHGSRLAVSALRCGGAFNDPMYALRRSPKWWRWLRRPPVFAGE